MPPRARDEIRRPAQIRALASPARQELLDLLARTGPATVAELARLVRRPADGLYYHLRALRSVGLVSDAGSRMRAGRAETLFQSTRREPALQHDPGPGGNSPDIAAVVSSMLRLGIRDFRRAAASGAVRTRGPGRELWALRVNGWLSPRELREVNQRIRGLRDAVGRRGPHGKLYAITILLTPLEHRVRKKQRKPRAPRRRLPR